MGRVTKTGFNNSVESDMGSGASLAQSLLIQVQNDHARKHLQTINASVNQTLTGSYAQVDRVARLLICTGNLPQDSDEAALVFSPFANNVSQIKGVDRVLFSTVFRNEITLALGFDILVIEGQTLNVLLGCAWTQGDSILTASASHGFLSVEGRESIDGQDNFAWIMR